MSVTSIYSADISLFVGATGNVSIPYMTALASDGQRPVTINANFIGLVDKNVTVIPFTLLENVGPTRSIATIYGSHTGYASEMSNLPSGQAKISPVFTYTDTGTIPVTSTALGVVAKVVSAIPEVASTTASPTSSSDSARGGSLTEQTSTSATAAGSTSASGQGPIKTGNTGNYSKGLAAGPVAGVAIACLIIGAVIAAALVFFCLRRRQRNKRTPMSRKEGFRSHDMEGEALVMTTGPNKTWEKQLPQPESDQTITQLVNRTLDDIELFVENFYTDHQDTLSSTAASNLGYFNSYHLEGSLLECMQASTTPTVLIKHALSNYLLQKIQSTRTDGNSLLPAECTIPSKGNQQMLSQARVLIAQSRSDLGRDEDHIRQRDLLIQTFTQQVEQAFQPWARRTTQDRAKNLKGIVVHLSEMGLKLFSQPAVFEWKWSEGRNLSGGQIVMLPGLDKVTDSNANKLSNPISLVKPRLGNYRK